MVHGMWYEGSCCLIGRYCFRVQDGGWFNGVKSRPRVWWFCCKFDENGFFGRRKRVDFFCCFFNVCVFHEICSEKNLLRAQRGYHKISTNFFVFLFYFLESQLSASFLFCPFYPDATPLSIKQNPFLQPSAHWRTPRVPLM